MYFLVERSLKELLDRAETYLWLQGFHISLTKGTETTSLFLEYMCQKGFFGTLLSAFVEASTPVQKTRLLTSLRLLTSQAGEGRTRLTIIESRQRELPCY